MGSHFDVLVIGAGINGLSTAYHLGKQKNLRVGVIEQFSLNHTRGSSHGASRIYRAAYRNPVYCKLAKRAYAQHWPELETETKRKLLYPTVQCAFGEGSSFEAWAKTILENDPEIEVIDPRAARTQFPQFRFEGCSQVLRNPSSAVIAAKETLQTLAQKFQGTILKETKVLKIYRDCNPIVVETTQGSITADRLVITAGAWIGKLVPELSYLFSPVKQLVGYFKLKGINSQLGSFPNWVHFGRDNVFYGIPEFGIEGIKVAQDITDGQAENPDEEIAISPKKLLDLKDFVTAQFNQPIERFVHSETCFYTNTQNSQFILDLLDSRIAIGAACSGHAFKFAPLTGKILAELVLHGKSSVLEFEENRKFFSKEL